MRKGEKNYLTQSTLYTLTTNDHCLVAINAFLRFFQVYPDKSTDATHTIAAMSIFINSFGIPQKLLSDRGTSFMSTDFSTFFLQLGITHAPRTK